MFNSYQPGSFFDEAFSVSEAGSVPREHYSKIISGFDAYGEAEFGRRRALIDLTLRNQGITFTVYGDEAGTERTFPFDPFPRVIPADEWAQLEKGLIQRVRALNLFLEDIYHDQEILKDEIVPEHLVLNNPNYRRQVHGIDVPHRAYTHIVGCDLIRDDRGTYRVLEDNLRNPSGVSYMLANRTVMARSFPKLMAGRGVRPIAHYTSALFETLRSLSPRDIAAPTIVILTPGQYNSAYYEHAFLAQQMGVELVEGRDLYTEAGRVWMRTTRGKQQVDVIYRRIDDDFLDPQTFREESSLGVPGLVEVYRAGRVALANAIGTGVADDKAIYAYVPEIIRYYLNEEPLITQRRDSSWGATRRGSSTSATTRLTSSSKRWAARAATECSSAPRRAKRRVKSLSSGCAKRPATTSRSPSSSSRATPPTTPTPTPSSPATWTCAPTSSWAKRSPSSPAG